MYVHMREHGVVCDVHAGHGITAAAVDTPSIESNTRAHITRVALQRAFNSVIRTCVTMTDALFIYGDKEEKGGERDRERQEEST